MSSLKTIRDRIRKHLSRAMGKDRLTLARELDRIEKTLNKNAPEAALRRLKAVEKKLGLSMEKKARRKAGVPRSAYPETLPITARKDEIIGAIRRNPVVVITGETGSGKTTQIPKMCLEAGRGVNGMIGHTQPRRIAAITAARRIAEEMGEPLGRSVGYRIRFDERLGPDPYIKIMTDGILLAEVQTDARLLDYDTIIVDEAHERSLNIDFILGILKSLLHRRRDLKVVITSATIDAEKFSRAFGGAPVIEVSGRLYPVEVRYTPLDPELEESGDWTYVDAAIQAVEDIRKEGAGGDILLFMPTEADIRETCDLLAARIRGGDLLLPLFARLTWEDQRRVFQPAAGRKIVVATNVAETSITIPGIRYVIDTGLARISRYNPRTRTLSLPVTAVSRSSADQRKGRCGRVADGVCVRLYGEEDYEGRPLYTPPEILRSNLAEVILRMLALSIGDIASFPFIDPPDPKSIRDGIEVLRELGAIGTDEKGKGAHLTERGRLMARMPIDPRISRMILEAEKEGCLDEVAVIAAALSIQDPREWPAEKLEEARRVHEPFRHPASDFMTLLNIWSRFHETWETFKTQNRMRKFCREHFLSYRRMREWTDLHGQIGEVLTELGILKDKREKTSGEYDKLYGGIHRSILSGCLSNIALKKEKNIYTVAKGREAMIFPGSSLFNRGSEWIVAAEMVETSRLFARTAAHIESEWIEALGADLCRYSCSNPRWERKRGEVTASEQVTLFGLVIVSGRPVSYGRIDPGEASKIFIRRALVEGDMERPLPFLRHNLERMENVARMEDKLRRRDILADEEALAAFYESRLEGVFDIPTLRKRIRERGGDDFLRMREEDLLRYRPDASEIALYPEKLQLGPWDLSLAYRFDPRDPEDGATLKVPQRLLSLVPAESVDWAVPGHLREKIAGLLKGLPKGYRKKLLPLAGTVDTILAEMPRGRSSLLSALGAFIQKRFGVTVPASAWDRETLPDHLKMRLAVVDPRGREIASGRNIGILKENIAGDLEVRDFEAARAAWEKKGLTCWDFGDLPEIISIGEGSHAGVAFPGLEAGEEGVHLRLFKSSREAEASHRRGVLALFALHFAKELRALKRQLTLSRDFKVWAAHFGGEKKLEQALYDRILESLFGLAIRKESDFLRLAGSAAPKILPRSQEILADVAPVLGAFHETRQILSGMETENRSNRAALSFLKDMRTEMDRLVPENFMTLYEKERLPHLPRYLEALSVRARSGLLHLEKDRERAEKVRPFASRLDDLLKSLTPSSSDEKRKAAEEFRWMIEEYRVSVFAQKVGTAFPVSPKRLEERLKEIAGMV
jgi:ATP-dependent helicase HrpA